MIKADNIETTGNLSNEELENALVGYMMSASFKHIQEMRERIGKTEYFYFSNTRQMYQLICWFNDKGEEVDPIKLQREVLKRKLIPIDVFASLMSYQAYYPSYIMVLEHIDILVEYGVRRELRLVGNYLEKAGTTVGTDIPEVAEEAKRMIDKITLGTSDDESVSMQDVLVELQKRVDDNISGKNLIYKTNTGFEWLDKHGGLYAPELDIIAADSGMGKTSFADSIALNVIQQGKKIVFFSLEMTREQLTARMHSHFSKLKANQILKDKLDSEQLSRFDQGVGSMWEFSKNLFFNDKAVVTIDALATSIRKHKAKYDICGVIVDYIQLVGGQRAKENDETFLARIARTLKNLCLELNIWIIGLSQINRKEDDGGDSNTKKLPTRNRLRGSGQITEAADNIWMIYRPEYYNITENKTLRYPPPFENVNPEGTAEIIVAKGRSAGNGAFIVGFDADTTHFYNLDKVPTICLTAEQAQSELNSNSKLILNNTKEEFPF